MNEKELPNASPTANDPMTETQASAVDLDRTLDSTIIVDDNRRTAGSINRDSNTGESGPVNVVHKARARKVYGGMWGPTELAAAGGSLWLWSNHEEEAACSNLSDGAGPVDMAVWWASGSTSVDETH